MQLRKPLRSAVLTGVILASLAATSHAAVSPSRPPLSPTSGELEIGLRKLSVTGTVLYVAAHPDDENTALLSYFTRERMVRTGYLSITRGDGGQNLIGSEIGEALGVIRTQELLEARRVDGAEQFFTRAIDFGYSKSSDEALEVWGHDEVLADVVWVVRTFRPDVIVTRFPSEGRTHGHHTASARLAREAFAAAADPTRFPDQIGVRHGDMTVTPWQVKRVVWNAWRRAVADRGADVKELVSADVGAFNSLLGKSYAEIAAESRSMHKSQGFGARARRGSEPNYFEPLEGEEASEDLFEGVDLTWGRIEGGAAIERQLRGLQDAFDPNDPSATVPGLVRLHAAIAAIDDPLAAAKRREVEDLIRDMSGLWLEAVADQPSVTPGDTLRVGLTAVKRSGIAASLESVTLRGSAMTPVVQKVSVELADNEPIRRDVPMGVSTVSASVSQPYWLRTEPTGGRFVVEDRALLGRAETPPVAETRFVVRIAGGTFAYDVPVLHRSVDRVIGERYRRVEIVPPATARLEQSVRMFPDSNPRDVDVVVRAHRDGAEGLVRLGVPPGWRVEPRVHDFVLSEEGAERRLRFTVHPPAEASSGDIVVMVSSGASEYSHGLIQIDYPHIPVQDLFPVAKARVVRTDIATAGKRIGYVMGSGDYIPEALREIGYEVSLLDDDQVAGGSLEGFDAVVVGVRAYNTRPRLRALQPRLLDYVEKGGTLVVQYNTRSDDLNDRLGPYPFEISRDRVSVEEAPVRFVNAEHPLLTSPNRITQDDFTGWVQERGLYFANPYDERYETVLSSNDPGEPSLEGGLLYARHGKGVFIYTGYSFFRELPAGVPGAYRLFVNLVSARP